MGRHPKPFTTPDRAGSPGVLAAIEHQDAVEAAHRRRMPRNEMIIRRQLNFARPLPHLRRNSGSAFV